MESFSPERIEEEKLYKDMGLTEQEYEKIKNLLKRRPNYTETGIFSVMWSEHCSYKSSKPLLKMLPSKGKHVIFGPGEGAGVVDIGDGEAIVFKIESHNSPSAVEPFEGAATGVGGIVRDVFSMGARPIALLNSLRFGFLHKDQTKKLFQEVVRGLAHYGNTLKVPTVGGEIQFDACYEENPLVNAMCVGLIEHGNLQKGVAKGPGNVVIYAGGKTGRDGIHGATFSSEELEENREHTSQVAIGNPKMQKRLIEACLEVVKQDGLVGMQDMGAAGLTSSASEMASKANTGIELILDDVPKREEQMTAYEMMLSESQERMLLVVEKGKEDHILSIFRKYDVPAAVIGRVLQERVFRVLYQEKTWAEVPVDALDKDAPVDYLPTKERVDFKENQKRDLEVYRVESLSETFKQLLIRPTIANKQWVYNQFEGDVLQGPGSGVGVVQIKNRDKAIAMTVDGNSRYVNLDPYTGGKIAVAEASRNLICSGARPLALTDGLNYGNPTNPEVFWEMEQSIQGIKEASLSLEVPVVSGNVSLYNQSQDEAIYPTPIIGMVGLMESLSYLTPVEFQQAGDHVYVIGEAKADFGGSELQYLLEGNYFGKAPEICLSTERDRQQRLCRAIQRRLIQSASDLSVGGLAIALAKSVLPTTLGVNIQLFGNEIVELFSETQSRFIVTIKEENEGKFLGIFPEAKQIGVVTEEKEFSITVNQREIICENIEKLRKQWEQAIPNMLKNGE